MFMCFVFSYVIKILFSKLYTQVIPLGFTSLDLDEYCITSYTLILRNLNIILAAQFLSSAIHEMYT